jgi:hypothetical protein
MQRGMGVAADERERQDQDKAAGERRLHKRRGLGVVLDYLPGIRRLWYSTDPGQRLGGTCRVVGHFEMGEERPLTAAPLPLPLDFA